METEQFALGFDLTLYVDWFGIAAGVASIWYIQKLKRAGKTLDRAAVYFVWGIGIFTASLVWERFAEAFLPPDIPYEEPHHALMMLSLLTLMVAATKFVPEEDALVKEARGRASTADKFAESERRFQVLTKLAPVGFFETDAAGDCLYVNDRWRRFAGMETSQAMGKGWLDALHPDDRERVMKEWYEAAVQGKEFSSRYRFLAGDGKVIWLQGAAVALRDGGGAVTGYLGTVSDITQLIESERAQRESAEEIDRVNRALVGREKRMIELKTEIHRLKSKC